MAHGAGRPPGPGGKGHVAVWRKLEMEGLPAVARVQPPYRKQDTLQNAKEYQRIAVSSCRRPVKEKAKHRSAQWDRIAGTTTHGTCFSQSKQSKTHVKQCRQGVLRTMPVSSPETKSPTHRSTCNHTNTGSNLNQFKERLSLHVDMTHVFVYIKCISMCMYKWKKQENTSYHSFSSHSPGTTRTTSCPRFSRLPRPSPPRSRAPGSATSGPSRRAWPGGPGAPGSSPGCRPAPGASQRSSETPNRNPGKGGREVVVVFVFVFFFFFFCDFHGGLGWWFRR